MRLLTQPESGAQPLLSAIDGAKKCIELVIFRMDRGEIERALGSAVSRGVFVHSLIAHTTGAGGEQLRKLELRLLEAGINVARTAGELRRYHNKMMIVDRRTLFLLGFNFTSTDIAKSRSFGVVTRDAKTVQDAVNLFEADTKRQVYEPAPSSELVVSPVNARQRLTAFLEGAKKQLLIYDLRISDKSMLRVLEQRAKAGVEIRVIGSITANRPKLEVRSMPELRLHIRAIIRDSKDAFVGSMSLRATELDARREAGIIFRHPAIVKQMAGTFEDDWQQAVPVATRAKANPSAKVAKRVAEAVIEELPPMAPVVAQAMEKLTGTKNGIGLDHKSIEQTVRQAVKQAVKGSVKEMVAEAANATKT